MKKRDRVEIYRDTAGQYRFRVRAANGQIIGIGEAYTRLWSAKRGAKRAHPRGRIVLVTSLLLLALSYSLSAQTPTLAVSPAVVVASSTPTACDQDTGLQTHDETTSQTFKILLDGVEIHAFDYRATKTLTTACPVDCRPSAWVTTTTGPLVPATCPSTELQLRTDVQTRSIIPALNGGACPDPRTEQTVTVQVACTFVPPPPPPPVPPNPTHTGSGLAHGIPDFGANPTVTSGRGCSWSDPNCWSTKRLPAAGDRVVVDEGVTYDVVSDAPIAVVRVVGSLTFRRDISTRLTVGTLLVEHGGTLDIGSSARPIEPQAKAEVVWADLALDTTRDPEQFGIGLLCFGVCQAHGSPKLAFERLSAPLPTGSTKLPIPAPSGWLAGDKLVLPDTRQLTTSASYVPQWEEVTYDGSAISPTKFLHDGARDQDGKLTFLPHVANLTRNVIFRSANPQGVRGHAMFSHRAEVDIRYAQFDEMGRTLPAPLNNTAIDSDGHVIRIGTNQIGRYPIHFHHDFGPSPATGANQFTLIGNVITNAPKWGIALHNSHYGLVRENVIYNVGSGIVTEDGSESFNVIERNFVLRVNGQGNRGDGRGMTDLAWEGTGYWLRGFNNTVKDNIAANVRNDYGFKLFAYYLGNTRVPNFPGADTTVAGQYTTVNGNGIPIRLFSGNEAYGATGAGLTYWWLNTVSNNPVANPQPSVIAGQKVWHITDKAVFHYHAVNLTIEGLVIRGNLTKAKATTGWNPEDYFAKNVTISNADIQGMTYGIVPSAHSGNGFQLVRDSFLRNAVNVSLRTMWTSGADATILPPRAVEFRNVRFATPTQVGSVPNLAIQTVFSASPQRHLVQKDTLKVVGFNGDASDNFSVFYKEQAPAFLVPKTVINTAGYHTVESVPVSGLTNAEAWTQYGKAIAGAIAPCDTKRVGIDGFVCQ